MKKKGFGVKVFNKGTVQTETEINGIKYSVKAYDKPIINPINETKDEDKNLGEEIFKDACKMGFGDALKFLNIYDYRDRIFDSNSRGELLHLTDYIMMASTFKHLYKGDLEVFKDKFREEFIRVVDYTEKHWERPKSVYQHISKLIDYNSIFEDSK